MKTLEQILWLIESRFRGDLSLDDLARETGISRFHVSRLFSYAIGQTVSGYIRRRRLTEAAKLLAGGSTEILPVALEAGYNSHEAFTRAFTECFGVPPSTVKSARSLDTLQVQEAIRMPQADMVDLAPPKLIDHPAKILAGLRRSYKMNNTGCIPDQWQQFVPWHSEFAPRPHGHTYGVIVEPGNGDAESFDYFCGFETPPGFTCPPELQLLDLPAMRMAVFVHEGHVSGIAHTCQAIFSHGLADSGLSLSGTVSFFERYGEDFDAKTGHGRVELFMHVADA